MLEKEGVTYLNVKNSALQLHICQNTFYRHYQPYVRYVLRGKRKFYSWADMEALTRVRPAQQGGSRNEILALV